MTIEIPKKEEEFIYNLVIFDVNSTTIKLSKEQNKLFNWLWENGYFRGDLNIGYGFSCENDLTK